MFERYTEQARRALFFARFEAFQLRSAFIESEHLLLGLLRDEQSLTTRLFARARLSFDEIQRQVKARTVRHAPLSASSEVPFSDGSKRVLHYAAQEADRLLHGEIGTEHLLLGLLREEHGVAAIILNEHGLRLSSVRDDIVVSRSTASPPSVGFPPGPFTPPGEVRLLRVSPTRRASQEGPLVVISPQRVSADGFTLRELIAWAYRVDARFVGVPAGFDDRERYDARLDLPGPQSWPTIDRMVPEGIKKHFAIEIAGETNPMDVFVLTATIGPSPGRRQHDEEPGGAMMYTGFSTLAFSESSEPLPSSGPHWRDRLHSVGPISLTATTIEDFGHWLEEFVGHPVIDETGLAGRYDIDVQGELQGLDELRQALAEQLALVLTRTKRDMPMLVVRRAAT